MCGIVFRQAAVAGEVHPWEGETNEPKVAWVHCELDDDDYDYKNADGYEYD